MKTLIITAALLLALSAHADSRKWVSPDFFVQASNPGLPLPAAVTDCRDNISQAICHDRFVNIYASSNP